MAKARQAPPRKDFDPAVADQSTMLILTGAQRSLQLNGAAARNQLAAVMGGLTLAVQQNNAAMLRKLTKLNPLDAAVYDQITKSMSPTYFAGLNVGSGVPREQRQP